MPTFLCAALFQDLAGDATRAIGAGGSAFNDKDVLNTGTALMIYGCGLPAFVMQKVFAAAFFAREDTKTPMTFALVAIALNAIISISLFPVIGFLSVPIGTIAASWTEVLCLAIRLRMGGFLAPGLRLVGRLARMVGLAWLLGMALTQALAAKAVLLPFAFGQEWILLFELTALGAAAYIGAAMAIGAISPRDIRPARS